MSFPHGRWAHVAALALVAVVVAGAFLGLTVFRRAPGAARAASTQAPIGIVNAIGSEQAAILSIMHVSGSVTLEVPLLHRHDRRSPRRRRRRRRAGRECRTGHLSARYPLPPSRNAVLGHGRRPEQYAARRRRRAQRVRRRQIQRPLLPRRLPAAVRQPGGADDFALGPARRGDQRSRNHAADAGNAAKYGGGPSSTAKDLPDVAAFAAPHQLVALGEDRATLGTTKISDATGDSKRTGTIADTAIAGVVGQAPVWTEPLSVTEAQNLLYQNDTEENEGTGFAFANAQLGVPWLLVRGISDSVWYRTFTTARSRPSTRRDVGPLHRRPRAGESPRRRRRCRSCRRSQREPRRVPDRCQGLRQDQPRVQARGRRS